MKEPSEAFVKLPRNLLGSDAWRSLSINARRLLDFLMIEHMRHGGKANGRLIAPWRQLCDFGIGDHFIGSAIEECDRVGLAFCRRGVGRAPTLFTLAWLQLANGDKPPDAKWQAFRLETTLKSDIVPAKQQSLHVPAKQQAQTVESAGTKPVVPAKRQAQGPKKIPAKQQAPSRESLTAGGEAVGVRPASPHSRPARNSQPPGKPNGAYRTGGRR
jgi:hypothetical protein